MFGVKEWTNNSRHEFPPNGRGVTWLDTETPGRVSRTLPYGVVPARMLATAPDDRGSLR